jgi:methanogenic corrinoid protein MtbC1/DNA-binding transcriptional regulator YhcF (GntR family)
MLYDLGPRARRVYSALLERIGSGELAPGTRLPSHTRLAHTFGVAPLTMRQVLARLEADTLLVREHGRGTFVRPAEQPDILIVAADPAQRTGLVQRVHRLGRQPMLATTAAEGLAALDREPSLAVLVVDLHLPSAAAGLAFVRLARRRRPAMLLIVVNPTASQRTRLAHTVSPAPVYVDLADALALDRVLGNELGTVGQYEPPSSDVAPSPALNVLLERYLSLQLAGERVAARELLLQQGLSAGISITDLYLHVLAPAQSKVGELWQQNQITVAREHLATAVTETIMAELMAAAPSVPSTGPRVLVACVEGELHDIGARMVADLLELDGFEVRFLGANVPTDSLLTIVQEEQPRLLVLSATMPERIDHLRQAITSVRQVRGLSAVLVGGQVLDWLPDLAPKLRAAFTTRDALHLLEVARQIRTFGAVGGPAPEDPGVGDTSGASAVT